MPKKDELTVDKKPVELKETEKQSQLPAVLPDMKAFIKKANDGLKHFEEVQLKVKDLKDRSAAILKMDPEDKNTYTLLVAWSKEERELRNGLDNERKIVTAPFNNAVSSINAVYNGSISDLKDVNAPMKILRSEIEAKEEERLENKRQEKLKVLNHRIEIIRGLGGKLRPNDGRWVIQEGEEPSDNDIELTQAEIQAFEEDNWIKLQTQAVKMAAATLEREQLAKQKKEQQEAEFKKNQEKLANDLLAMENERFMSRKDNLFILGFAEDGEYTVMGKLKFKTEELKRMDSDAWINFMTDVKGAITNQKKEDEFNKRVSRLSSLGFVNQGGDVYKFTIKGFSFTITREEIESIASVDLIIDDFNSHKASFDKLTERKNKMIAIGFEFKEELQSFVMTSKLKNTFTAPVSAIESDEFLDKALREGRDWYSTEEAAHSLELAKQKRRADILNGLGLHYSYTTESFSYKSLVPTQKDFMVLKHTVDSSTEEEFDTMVKDVSKYIEVNKAAKDKADKLQKENEEKDRLQNNSDKRNITEFSEAVRTRANAFTLKSTKQISFNSLLNSFLKSISEL